MCDDVTRCSLIIRELWLARHAIRKDSVYKHREQRATAAICVIVTLFLALHTLFVYDIAVVRVPYQCTHLFTENSLALFAYVHIRCNYNGISRPCYNRLVGIIVRYQSTDLCRNGNKVVAQQPP